MCNFNALVHIVLLRFSRLYLNESLTVNSDQFYFDCQDGKYGFNTSPERGADTFHPFKSGGIEIGYFHTGSITGANPADAGNRLSVKTNGLSTVILPEIIHSHGMTVFDDYFKICGGINGVYTELFSTRVTVSTETVLDISQYDEVVFYGLRTSANGGSQFTIQNVRFE